MHSHANIHFPLEILWKAFSSDKDLKFQFAFSTKYSRKYKIVQQRELRVIYTKYPRNDVCTVWDNNNSKFFSNELNSRENRMMHAKPRFIKLILYTYQWNAWHSLDAVGENKANWELSINLPTRYKFYWNAVFSVLVNIIYVVKTIYFEKYFFDGYQRIFPRVTQTW